MPKNRFMGDDEEAKAQIIIRKEDRPDDDEPADSPEEAETSEESDEEQAEDDFLEWTKAQDERDKSRADSAEARRFRRYVAVRDPNVRLDAWLGERALALRAIASSGVDLQHPVDGVPWSERSDSYVRGFAVARMDEVNIEIENDEDSEDEASEDMSDRMGEEEGHDSEQRFLDWSDEQDREDASCRKDAGDDYERDEDGKFAGSGGGGGGYSGPRGGKRGGNDASNTASPHGKAAREHAKAAVEHARQVRAHAEKHPTDANKAAAASADKNSKNARASARKAEAESDPAKAAAHAAKAESHAKANAVHASVAKGNAAVAHAAKVSGPAYSSQAGKGSVKEKQDPASVKAGMSSVTANEKSAKANNFASHMEAAGAHRNAALEHKAAGNHEKYKEHVARAEAHSKASETAPGHDTKVVASQKADPNASSKAAYSASNAATTWSMGEKGLEQKGTHEQAKAAHEKAAAEHAATGNKAKAEEHASQAKAHEKHVAKEAARDAKHKDTSGTHTFSKQVDDYEHTGDTEGEVAYHRELGATDVRGSNPVDDEGEQYGKVTYKLPKGVSHEHYSKVQEANDNLHGASAEAKQHLAKAKEAIRAGKGPEAHALATKAIEAKQKPSIPGIPAAGYGSVAGTPLTKSQASELSKYPMGKPKKK